MPFLKTALLFIVLGVALPMQTVQATVLIELGLEELVAGAALIFTADVQDVTISTENGQVYSTVTFRIQQQVKGDVAEPVLALRFLGGSSAELQLEVTGQYIPSAGDRGLYFVTDPQSNQVNPLTGWSQGYFPLQDAADGTQYLDLRGHPDYASALGAPAPLASKMKALNFSAAQIEAHVPGSQEFPLADFVAAIRYLLEQGE
jgi:hypothetical protein